MGLEFKLSDRELPVSPAFIEFLAQVLQGVPLDQETWANQRSETLVPNAIDRHRVADAVAQVMGSALGRERLARAYLLLFALLTGDLTPLEDWQSRFHVVTCIGIPRTGGSYLTAELYRALGMLPQQIPAALAHDSFPEAGPFRLQSGSNSWVVSLKTLAEYLTMVETFFGNRQPHHGKIVVPKKLTKAVYAGGLFHQVLGPGTGHLVTVRHPVASCVSSYEKSGGLPADQRFVVRSNIEQWCRSDLEHIGVGEAELKGMHYFDAYLKYWEHFHVSLALTGLSASRHLQVIAFGAAALQSRAQGFHDLYQSGLRAAPFHSSDKARSLHAGWLDRAQPAIDRVQAAWTSVGLAFPGDEIRRCW